MADQGTGLTITFSSGFFGQIVNARISGMQRGDVETTHSGTTTWKTFKPSDLIDGGILEVEIHYSTTSMEPPITGATETVTVTLPLDAGQATAADIEFPGYMNSVDIDFTPIDDTTMKMMCRIKVAGAPTFTDAVAA
jgi:hypothetical protein